ncbi:MAG: 4-hydroxybenzoate octaprenyltransferase [Kordiimonadaceae bacterium]|nr:4-hydroxybenzoate octaprenyltransferase [Kordiimonadaceae bacterium]MBO6567222.1 4-hydroxybenzoate octaprenyltransferase [Kordiimonadaceae bacterium]MBO6963563.1 4-hydroxybenzoate octaprenyltransferase [Kordiimonadaceae bacterium]
MTDGPETIVETADAVKGSWVYRIAPVAARPYLKLARLDRPVGTWLLLWPCLWSMALSIAGYGLLELGYIALLFAIGSLVMRGAGCTYNDIVDTDIDAKVDRTKSRPIPAGEVSKKQAWAFLAFQCLIGLVVLLQFNNFAIFLGIGSLALVAAYPFMKRITGWPQAWLGLTFNWGALMGWAALDGALSWSAIVLYGACVFWTLGYDTIYAHQDKEDDALIGVGSTALTLGQKTKPALWVFYGLFFIGLLGAGVLANLGLIFYIGIAFAGTQLASQIRTVDLDDPIACLQAFRSNIEFGGIVLLAIILGHYAVW